MARNRSRKTWFPNVYPTIYLGRYTSQNENFEYGYPHSNALLQFELKLECCKSYKAARHRTKCDVIYDVKLFRTVYLRIHCCKFLTLSNRTSRYKLKCIRIWSSPLFSKQGKEFWKTYANIALNESNMVNNILCNNGYVFQKGIPQVLSNSLICSVSIHRLISRKVLRMNNVNNEPRSHLINWSLKLMRFFLYKSTIIASC